MSNLFEVAGVQKKVDGTDINFKQEFEGKKCVVVCNSGSFWGKAVPYMMMFAQMQAEFDDCQVVLYPCNQFHQEPQENSEIHEGAKKVLGDENVGGIVMMEKTFVNNIGEEREHPVYTFMKNSADIKDVCWTWGEMFIHDRRGRLRYVVSGLPWHAFGRVEELCKEVAGSEPTDIPPITIEYAEGMVGSVFVGVDKLFSGVSKLFPFMGRFSHLTTIFGKPMFNGFNYLAQVSRKANARYEYERNRPE